MPRQTAPLAVSLVLLVGLLSGSPATAQYTYYPSAHITCLPETDAAPTSKDISVQPPQLSLYPMLFMPRLHFKAKNDCLFLTQTIEGPIKDGKTEDELWSAPFGREPQRFMLKVTDTDQSISDSSGKLIWSEPLKPGLIMDFDQPGIVHVLDADGKELGGAPIDRSLPAAAQQNFHSDTPDISSLSSQGVRIETDPLRQQTSVYSGTRLVWSGLRPVNDGIQWGRALGSPVSGIALRQYPAGTTIDFQISRETGSLTVSDKERHPLTTVPTETLHFTVSSGDEKFRKDMRNFFLYHSQPTTTQVSLNTPGLIYAQYRTADGAWAGENSIHALKVLVTFTYRRKPETDLQIWTANFDRTGKRTGTFFGGLQTAKRD